MPGRWDEKAGLHGIRLRFPINALKVQKGDQREKE
jgi:hypothetical protein